MVVKGYLPTMTYNDVVAVVTDYLLPHLEFPSVVCSIVHDDVSEATSRQAMGKSARRRPGSVSLRQ
jgi:hypothetical protein